ncbi:MAG: glycine cleavage system aminomethyltransferase GcvT [Deltaproteobacteria bacterium]|nr:glycine cleavage system aminomethyltransferase GcvT [Deltaproteobacteria bacterium]
MNPLIQTVFHDRHVALGAKMVEFGGWDMPVMYPSGIVEEHLATRREAGLFDVSHMGRFVIRGEGAEGFLQHVLTNNAGALDPREQGAQYTIIANENGGAVDDAYLYRFSREEYLLVVNASNREKDWDHLQKHIGNFGDVELLDRTRQITMLALQGPMSRPLLEELLGNNALPEPHRNAVKKGSPAGAEIKIARTGYTGEPLCFELFAGPEQGLQLWDRLLEKGAKPIGLGARDTLRLEAGLPLYGHELGEDQEGREIPILACPIARFAVSFSSRKGEYVGRAALIRQFKALEKIMDRDFSLVSDLPRMVRPIAVVGRGIARQGTGIFNGGKHVGHVTSGTMVPLWNFEGEGLQSAVQEQHGLRSICLGYVDSDIPDDDPLVLEIRGKPVDGVVVPFHLRVEAPPYARPILYDAPVTLEEEPPKGTPDKVRGLLQKAIDNTLWRQRECMNLIPSEMTISPMARLLSVMDPSFRYAEHRKLKAFYDMDIFYYQGTEFIAEVEKQLEKELTLFLGCHEVESRLISGQMANTAVFSAMVDYLNRSDTKREPRRIRRVMNHHIAKGGHLSAQPMGALRDYVARDPITERPAVVNFPVLQDNPYKIDVPATLELIHATRPEVIIFGKSMFLHREPVMEVRQFLDSQGIGALVLYDMAHVLGLIGRYFQTPFEEGADLVTGSTHKTFFGTQRGIIASRFSEQDALVELWETIQRRAFPGSVSNHHLGTLLGLLMAAYEMNHFKDAYQQKVIANAKAFARALHACGLAVAGDPALDFTETHQVVVEVGYGKGPEVADRLEANNIICNFQATPDEEGFTASGALRLGVSEMTRFGMGENDFEILASLMHEVIAGHTNVIEKVRTLREGFQELRFCFRGEEYGPLMQQLHDLV